MEVKVINEYTKNGITHYLGIYDDKFFHLIEDSSVNYFEIKEGKFTEEEDQEILNNLSFNPETLTIQDFHRFLKAYLFLEGIATILFNGYNYLHYDKKVLTLPVKLLNTYNDPVKGKPQLHRLYNLLIMYPISLYIIMTTKFDNVSLFLYILLVVAGFIYNSYNYLNY